MLAEYPDSVMFASDYPHGDGVFPGAATELLESDALDAESRERVLFRNAARFYGFDTDDCAYYWFLEDIAMTFYYAVPRKDATREDQSDYLARFFPAFWRGYRSELELDPAWLDHVPLFLDMRALTLYHLVQVCSQGLVQVVTL